MGNGCWQRKKRAFGASGDMLEVYFELVMDLQNLNIVMLVRCLPLDFSSSSLPAFFALGLLTGRCVGSYRLK